MAEKSVSEADNFEKRCLVCITPQSNSKRLIDKGIDVLSDDGELHVLHISKGSSVFNSEQSSLLLQELFDYASEIGGVVHALSSENVAESIQGFIVKHKVTHLVLGEPPKDIPENSDTIVAKLKRTLPSVQVFILPREKAPEKQ